MQEEEKFIKRVWEKYEIEKKKNLKDEFYEKNQFIESNKRLMIRTVASFILAVVVTVSAIGGVYAVVQNSSEEKKIKQEQSVINPEASGEYPYGENGDFIRLKDDELDYNKVTTYEEYEKYKNNNTWENIIEMTEDDFKNYYLVIIGTESARRQGIYIYDIKENEEEIEFFIRRDEEENLNTVIFKKMEKSKENKKIKITYIIDKPKMEGYKNIDELPRDYSKEQAKEDGCVVVENNNFYAGKEKFKEFLEKSKNEENMSIRIVDYEISENFVSIRINDLEYRDGKCLFCCMILRADTWEEYEGKIAYIENGDIIKEEIKEDNKVYDCYTFENEITYEKEFIVEIEK